VKDAEIVEITQSTALKTINIYLTGTERLGLMVFSGTSNTISLVSL
jgi:hypothetical protein